MLPESITRDSPSNPPLRAGRVDTPRPFDRRFLRGQHRFRTLDDRITRATVDPLSRPLMTRDFASRITVPSDVMVSELGGESVLLNLRTETYFGLDDQGTAFWTALTDGPTIDAAAGRLLEEFDVDEATLRRDLSSFLDSLVEHGLVEIVAPEMA